MIKSPQEITESLYIKGISFLNKSTGEIICGGIMAGIFVSLAAVTSVTVCSGMSAYIGAGFTKLIFGIVFTLGLILIVFSGSELFTGSNMYIAPVYDNKKYIKPLIGRWSLGFLSNFVGAAITIVVILKTGVLENQAISSYMIEITEGKLNLTLTQAFTRGILCNFLVCLADSAGLGLAITLAAVVGGAMFGDNLSIISDTTIAATRTQGCEMRDKFKVNIFIAMPAAILTVVLLVIFGIAYGDLTPLTMAQETFNGFASMNDIFLVSMLTGGLAHMVTKEGGLEFLIQKIKSKIKGRKSAEIGIAAMVSVTDMAIANNTVSIIIDGPIAREIAEEYHVDPRRSASLLDTFACITQGMIPYGAQMLMVSSFTAGAVTAIDVMPLLWYQQLLAVSAILSIFIPFADGIIKKNPWNWEKKSNKQINEVK